MVDVIVVVQSLLVDSAKIVSSLPEGLVFVIVTVVSIVLLSVGVGADIMVFRVGRMGRG